MKIGRLTKLWKEKYLEEIQKILKGNLEDRDSGRWNMKRLIYKESKKNIRRRLRRGKNCKNVNIKRNHEKYERRLRRR